MAYPNNGGTMHFSRVEPTEMGSSFLSSPPPPNSIQIFRDSRENKTSAQNIRRDTLV